MTVSTPLKLSGALNAAAAQWAEIQVASGGIGGHGGNFAWVQRAADCGYDPYYAQGSGEGVYSVASSGTIAVGPAEAITGITYPGSGVHLWTPSSDLPAKCAGVAVVRNAAGNVVSWVALIAQYPASQDCPGEVAMAPGNSPTATPTSTPTKTPTPSPTPSPTPNANYGGTISLNAGWNLVTLPAGPIADILDTANGCFGAIYEYRGGDWLRYSPLVPAYANNLVTSSGGAFWIEGTGAPNCMSIRI